MKNILNGRCKDDFETWYIPYIRELREDYNKFPNDSLLRKFYRKPLSERFGVLQDFFDDKEIRVENTRLARLKGFYPKVNDSPVVPNGEWLHICSDSARKHAIQKANDLYNTINTES